MTLILSLSLLSYTRSIDHSDWVNWSDEFLGEFDPPIRITDANGMGWTPRLQLPGTLSARARRKKAQEATGKKAGKKRLIRDTTANLMQREGLDSPPKRVVNASKRE